MTTVQLALLAIGGSGLFAYLLFLAKRADDRKQEAEKERGLRITTVVDRYRDLVRRSESSNLTGMLKSGVLGLKNSEEVEQACKRIDAEGLTPAIPSTYSNELHGVDLLEFFRLLQARSDEARYDAGVRKIIEELRRP